MKRVGSSIRIGAILALLPLQSGCAALVVQLAADACVNLICYSAREARDARRSPGRSSVPDRIAKPSPSPFPVADATPLAPIDAIPRAEYRPRGHGPVALVIQGQPIQIEAGEIVRATTTSGAWSEGTVVTISTRAILLLSDGVESVVFVDELAKLEHR